MSETGVYPQFSLQSVEQKGASQQAGRPIFKDVEWLTIRLAGDSKTVIERKVRDDDRIRFREAYEAFRAGMKAPLIGTPLKEWPVMRPAQVSELAYLNIKTVEDVANMTEDAMESIGMGARNLKMRAEEWIKSAENGAPSQKLIAENERLTMEVDALKEQLKALDASITAMKQETPKRRRWKPKPVVSSLAEI